ncbi:MAG: RNA polymerase sigma-70 factor [Prolixibacteraceae bacterium]|nr:RNA polymerase sigma-70 factor [Prolixibacteraceae bacterium]
MVNVKTNTELLLQLKEGDIVAFDTIYGYYCIKLYAFAIRYVKIETDAEDIVQEVFIKIWQNRKNINVYSSFESYLFTIAYHSAINLLNKKVHEKRYFEYLYSIQKMEDTSELTDEIFFNELNRKIQLLLKELPPRQKEIFSLSREKGLSHEEIAQKLGISVNTVNNHIVTALNFIRRNLDNGMIANILFAYLFL